MSAQLRDLVDGEAELDDEEDDESFDDEGGSESSRRERTTRIDDSSEEEDDDDEEEAQRIRENFIVDEEEEEDDDDEAERRRRRKRRRAERQEETQLDEEDLDLIGEARPDWDRKSETQQKFKRLKRGHRDDDDRTANRRDLTQIFSDEEDDQTDERPYNGRPTHRGPADEFDDFIEDDYPEDEEERNQRQEDLEVARPRDRGLIVDTSGLDKEALDDFDAIFGNGEDYQWALQAEEEDEEREREEQNLELKDVFEPSQLQERLLTDEDNEIRFADEPERFQVERRPFKNLQLTPEQFKEEARWISSFMWPKKKLSPELKNPFNKAVAKVLEFFVIDRVEVPFVFQHRKDYLIHATRTENAQDPDAPEVRAAKLLVQDDLWKILELDIKFHGLIEKRNALEKTMGNIKSITGTEDPIVAEMMYLAETAEELQDLQDYVQFQYSAQLRELAATGATNKETKRPGARSISNFERIRNSSGYKFVKAYGITPDRLAQNALRYGKKATAEDDEKLPIDLADSLTDSYFDTGDAVISAARQMFAEELFMSPRMRKHFRATYYQLGLLSCRRTEKGLRKIDESHHFYEIKYLINQTIHDVARRPEIFLKMLKAEEDGLIEVTVSLHGKEREFRKALFSEFQSDNFSERADAWNAERGKVLDLAFPKLDKLIAKGVKESLRTACHEDLLKACRDEFSKRLDQAPYKPNGLALGTTPQCLIISNGMADPSRDPVCWAYVEEDGKVMEQGKFGDLSRDETQRDAFVKLIERRRPDVIGVSGYSAETHRLVKDLEALIIDKGLIGNEYEGGDDEAHGELLEVVVVNDEVARLYKDSPKALADHPTLNPVTRYCIALARYMQNPLKEYALLGKDVTSLAIHPCQNLLPQDKLLKTLETVMVDVVNLCGVDINEAVGDPYTANLLPYIAGLGPRKATAVIKAINANGGVVNSRSDLVGDPDSGKVPVVGPNVWNNCASFLCVEYDATNPSSDPLDNTRVHPEDYELGRKMAADALDLDEEDVKAEVEENGSGAIVRKLFKDNAQDKVNELILEEYAEQLEQKYNQRKRATLYTIRGELQGPYEELRHPFFKLSPDGIFAMFTGETKDSLCEGMIIPVNVRVVKDDFAIVKLDCGIEGRIEAHEVSARHSVRDVLQVGQTTRAKLLELNRKEFICKLSIREDALRWPYRKHLDHDRSTWDYRLEEQDNEDLTEKDKVTGRAQRVVKHPLFKPFNSTQAEEYLGSQAPGEVVIRPSSKGNAHLAVTWKVADGVYQHIDVLELDKENEFAVGRTLRVANKYSYTDLDELIVDHVKAMARKVDELMQHEKFQKGSKADLERWLTTYMDANPNRSTYAFCLDRGHPGYFFLCYKANRTTKVGSCSVRVVPHAYEMMGSQYPDMRALCNGFKLRWQSEQLKTQSLQHRGR